MTVRPLYPEAGSIGAPLHEKGTSPAETTYKLPGVNDGQPDEV
jgi:hypothetical protein